MPKTIKQRRGEILASLRGKNLISESDLSAALRSAEIESPEAVKRYTRTLEETGALERVEGGWKLSARSKRTAVIKIKVAPAENLEDVIAALKTTLGRFGKVLQMEVEI